VCVLVSAKAETKWNGMKFLSDLWG